MKFINKELLDDLTAKAANSPRKRSHCNIHDNLNEDIQRLLIGMQPETYFQPHRHPENYKKETLIILRGSCLCITFTDSGSVIESCTINRQNPICEFPDGKFHSLICLEKDTVLLEFKKGPYEPLPEDCFAHWAPAEGDPDTEKWKKEILHRLELQ